MKDIDEMDILRYMDILMLREEKEEETSKGYADELYL